MRDECNQLSLFTKRQCRHACQAVEILAETAGRGEVHLGCCCLERTIMTYKKESQVTLFFAIYNKV